MLFWLLNKNGPAFSRSLPRIIVPIVSCLLVAAVATGYYNYRVTGSPFRMAYQVKLRHLWFGSLFLANPGSCRLSPQGYARLLPFGLQRLRAAINRRGLPASAATRAYSWWQFYLGPLLTLPLLAFPWVIRQKKMRLPLAICLAMIAGFTVQTWNSPHYFSPATGALYILLVQCMRQLWHWRRAVA